MANLTDRTFWLNYWASKQNLVFEVPNTFLFVDLLKKLVQQNQLKTSLELGGFPGHYSVWLAKQMGVQASLLDFVIHPQIFKELLAKNGLKTHDIEAIEADLDTHQVTKTYDLVFSNGLIEHFENTEEIIAKHSLYLNKNGILLLTLPNFKSLNGLFQKWFDSENYEKHNINSMNLDLLKTCCKNLDLEPLEVRYDGKFMLWLENEKEKPFLVQWLKKITWFVGKVFFKLVPIETAWFSPYIVVVARKK